MNALDELAALLKRLPNNKKAAFVWAVCKSVDWDNGIMDAVSVADDLDYYDVQLGLTGLKIKPAIGSVCLLGILEGEDAAAFLIRAESSDLIELNSIETVFNGGENGGLIKVSEITKKLNSIEKDINTLKQSMSKWVPTPQDGGSALKASVASWAAQNLSETKEADIENDKIKH